MYIKYRACVNINSVEDEQSSDFIGFLQNISMFQFTKTNYSAVCVCIKLKRIYDNLSYTFKKQTSNLFTLKETFQKCKL